MGKKEKRLILITVILMIILIAILIYTVTQEPEYNKELYEQVYAEYEEKFSEDNILEENDEITQNKVLSNNIYMEQGQFGEEYRVAGKIGISKINIYSPIIYETTDELLKIGPTKLCGPEPNEVGNLCIIGHNYRNDQFFSNLSNLEIDDEIVIINNQKNSVKYRVYDKYEVEETDLSPTSQETNGKRELTLITCTKNKKYRFIVKCTEK